MSVVFVVAVPVVAGSWMFCAAAIMAAGASLGYVALEGQEHIAEDLLAGGAEGRSRSASRSVQLVMQDSGPVADGMMRGESFSIQRGDINATFRRDGRGAISVHVAGAGKSEAELTAAGEELMDRVRQQFAYAKVMAELEERGFEVVQQEMEADQSIRIRVRRWN